MVKYIHKKKMSTSSAILYNYFNSSEIFSNVLADSDLKHNVGSEDKPKHYFGKITYYRVDVLLLRRSSEFLKIGCRV